MPENKNPWLKKLLSWQSHDSVGVRVPFVEGRGNPLDKTLPTPLIKKLRDLIQSIKKDEESPRWIFLIGGPGNGKSEAVQDFVQTLDKEFHCDNKLIKLAKKKFNAELAPPVLDEEGDELRENSSPKLIEKIRRLIIIQDASASSSPDKNAAENLVKTLTNIILDLVKQEPPPQPPPRAHSTIFTEITTHEQRHPKRTELHHESTKPSTQKNSWI